MKKVALFLLLVMASGAVFWAIYDSSFFNSGRVSAQEEALSLEVVFRVGNPEDPWTLEELSQSVGMKIEDVIALNGLKNREVSPGQVLRVFPYTAFDEVYVSWYGEETQGKMASGEVFDPSDPNICAHRWLPFGTKVRLTCLATGKSVVVEVKDRGPYVDMAKRHFDVSEAAALLLGIHKIGVAKCRVRVLGWEELSFWHL